MEKIIPDCGHLTRVKCKTLPTRKDCIKSCERTLICGHQCKSRCAIECNNRKCMELVLQKESHLACGHNKVWVLCCDKYKGKFYFIINFSLKPKCVKLNTLYIYKL